jgi:hypothetical protein
MPAVVCIAALVLTLYVLQSALLQAGKYASRNDVEIFVAVGLFISYTAVASVGAWALTAVTKLKSVALRIALVIVVMVLFAAVLYAAPLLSFLVLTGICRFQLLCPDIANPVSWSLSGAVYSGQKPFAAAWVAPVILSAILYKSRLLRATPHSDPA